MDAVYKSRLVPHHWLLFNDLAVSGASLVLPRHGRSSLHLCQSPHLQVLIAGRINYPDGAVFAKIGIMSREDPDFTSSKDPGAPSASSS
jgi:hypothetical protein